MYVRRPDWQSQHSSALALQAPTRLRLRDLPFWILKNLAEPLSVEDFAARVAMRPRNFSRQLVPEIAVTPIKFVTQLCVEMASRLIRESNRRRIDVALQCGFGSLDSMERGLPGFAGRSASS